MTGRGPILAGMVAGGAWAVCVVAAGRLIGPVPLPAALAIGLLPGGLVLMALIARLAARRLLDDALVAGGPFRAGPDVTTARVLANSVEQLVLAAATWPFVGWALGGGHVVALGLAFGVTRALFWLGYAASPPLRAFGFAGGFYPTILAVAAALVAVAT